MIIPSHIKDSYSAAQYWVKAKVIEDEARMENYARPIMRLPRATNFIRGLVAIRAFAAQVHKESHNFVFSI